jgi:hypothetical protein
LIEPAEPTEIYAGSVEEEHVDLMVSDADLLASAAQEPHPLELGGVIEPHGDIDILGRVKMEVSSHALW